MATRTPAQHRARRPPRQARARPGVGAHEFRDYLLRRAAIMAPADVRLLLSRAAEIRRRTRAEGAERPGLRRHVEIALDLLRDHAAGRVVHVPYHAVGVLAAALFYYLEPIDVIPDFVRGAGTDDDALVLALAHGEAADGIARYQAWREVAGRPVRRPGGR